MGKKLRIVHVIKFWACPCFRWPWWYRPVCRDLDEDCQEIEDKTNCQAHEPCRGLCPFLWPERN